MIIGQRYSYLGQRYPYLQNIPPIVIITYYNVNKTYFFKVHKLVPHTPTPMICNFTDPHGHVCTRQAFTVYESQPLCRNHLFDVKSREDCPICYSPMFQGSRRIMLSCGHFFHTDCIGLCKDPVCPLCREKMLPKEATDIFTPTIFKPVIEDVYSLSPDRITSLIDTFASIISISRKGDWQCREMTEIVTQFERACNIAEQLDRDRDGDGDDINNDNGQEAESPPHFINLYTPFNTFAQFTAPTPVTSPVPLPSPLPLRSPAILLHTSSSEGSSDSDDVVVYRDDERSELGEPGDLREPFSYFTTGPPPMRNTNDIIDSILSNMINLAYNYISVAVAR